jgi:hypothetical protein
MTALRIAAAYAVPLAFVLAFHPLLSRDRRVRIRALVVGWAICLFMPLLVPLDHYLVRFIAALIAVIFPAKLLDLALMRSRLPSYREYLAFMSTPFVMVFRCADAERSRGRDVDLRLLYEGIAWIVPGSAAVTLAWSYEEALASRGIVVEQLVKLVSFYVALSGILLILTALQRLAGQPARVVLNNIFVARTPADFWRRYNRPVNQYLFEDVFKKVGGRRRPLIATLIAFAISGAGHEYLFSIAIGRVQGLQMAFFLIQGLGVAATLRVRPTGATVPIGIALTLAFNFATSFLFFESFQEGWPIWFYAK